MNIAAKLIDTKGATERRYRNILANSGDIMESGEIRDLSELYVMSYDGELIKISSLATDPDKQTEKYAVKAQADHGEIAETAEGVTVIPTIEKQFGSCRVWLEKDGLHARMYFAENDALADHAWAISEDASYSTGIDWFPEGYEGVGMSIDHPIGILREISMVLTGNDPRAKTIDSNNPKLKGAPARVTDDAEPTTNENKESKMAEEVTKTDGLSAAERDALVKSITEAVDKLVDAPVEGTAEAADQKDAEGETEAPKEESKDSLHMPVLVVRDSVKQEKVKVAETKDWIHSKEGHKAFADCMKKAGGVRGSFDQLWRQEVSKHMSLDGITGLPTPAPVEQMFLTALEKNDGIISHFSFANTKSYRVNVLYPTNDEGGRAKGHKAGDAKVDQALVNAYRDVLCKMVYKRLPIDALELWENPELIDVRSRELVDAIIVEIERAAIAGDGRSSATPDLRLFDGTRGFFSVAADAAAVSGIGTYLASSITAGANLYEDVVNAKSQIKTEGAQYLVTKASKVAALKLLTNSAGAYLVPPTASIEETLGVARVYTPAWMDADATNDAYLVVDGAYKLIGQNTINTRTDFDTTYNTDILLDETPRGGSLSAIKSAVAIAAES
jgi:hypothetical protein